VAKDSGRPQPIRIPSRRRWTRTGVMLRKGHTYQITARGGSIRRRRPGRAAAPHGHQEGQEDRRGRLPDHQRPRRRPGRTGSLGSRALGGGKPSSLGPRRHLPGRQVPGQGRERAPRDGIAAQPGHQLAAPGRPRQHRRRQPPPRPRPPAHAKTASGCMNATLPCSWSLGRVARQRHVHRTRRNRAP
jgi:hypothetical protein